MWHTFSSIGNLNWSNQGPPPGYITWFISQVKTWFIMGTTAYVFSHGTPVILSNVLFFIFIFLKKIFFFSKHFKMGLARIDKPFKKSSKAYQTCFHICSHYFNGLNWYLSILRRKIFPFINISCHKMFITGIFIWGHDCIYWRALFRVDV